MNITPKEEKISNTELLELLWIESTSNRISSCAWNRRINSENSISTPCIKACLKSLMIVQTAKLFQFILLRSTEAIKFWACSNPPKNEGRYVSLMNANNSRYLLQSIPWLDITWKHVVKLRRYESSACTKLMERNKTLTNKGPIYALKTK